MDLDIAGTEIKMDCQMKNKEGNGNLYTTKKIGDRDMKFKWTVEFEVDEVWVSDGFEMTDEIARNMIAELLGWSTPDETSARVIKSPDKSMIRKIQGYEG